MNTNVNQIEAGDIFEFKVDVKFLVLSGANFNTTYSKRLLPSGTKAEITESGDSGWLKWRVLGETDTWESFRTEFVRLAKPLSNN